MSSEDYPSSPTTSDGEEANEGSRRNFDQLFFGNWSESTSRFGRHQRDRSRSPGPGPSWEDDEEALRTGQASADDRKEAKRANGRDRGSVKNGGPPPPRRVPVRFPTDDYDYKARRQELIAASGGKMPFCFYCSWTGGQDEAQQTAYARMKQGFVDNFGEMELLPNARIMVAYYNKAFKQVLIARAKKALSKERDDAKLEKSNIGQPWTDDDEKKYAWTAAREQEFIWEEAEAVYHMMTFPPPELAHKRMVHLITQAINASAEAGLLTMEETTGRLVVDRDELLKISVLNRVKQSAEKAIETIHKTRARLT